MMKMRTCKVCRARFRPVFNSMQAVCGIACALEFTRQEAEKKRYSAARAAQTAAHERKQAHRKGSKARQREAATRACNAYIRWRDRDRPCCGCGKQHYRAEAGHYHPAGRATALRFHPDNIQAQCHRCNCWEGGGKATGYKDELAARAGSRIVDYLDRHANDLYRYSAEEYRDIAAWYRQRLRQEKDNE